ncbi:amidase signature enzyme [Obba rivulosa]|uniref:Amidase signature enzyme n=1 Tax=Obba rivulosa TaxID=1052685 RepID=A0A8E2DKS0_9APHY|nr:amidase signature enzyme [Obba rivulosa]
MGLLVKAAFVAAAAPFAAAAQVSFQLTGKTLVLDSIPYFVPPSPVSAFEFNTKSSAIVASVAKSFADELIPFSVVFTSALEFSESAFEATVNAWKTQDDVFSDAFLTGVFVTFNGTAHPHVAPSVSLSSTTQKKFGIDFLFLSEIYPGGISLKKSLPSGPFFLKPSTGEIFEAYRLFNDENQAFVYGVIPDGNGGFQELNAHIEGAATSAVAVPSRLYFTPTAEKPLAGKRLGLKDIYDVKGLRTGCGNRAFFQLNPPKNATAPAVQRLLDGGMVLVGKMKTSQFANGETATDDWIDLHAPYNPRGDGYQDASSSSTGPAVGMSSYDFLDHAVGSDTGGSMRGPAGACGLYGNRPSHGAVDLTDVMPLSPEMDTGGVFAKNAKDWAAVGHFWYQNLTSFSKFPKKIIFPVDVFGRSFLTNPPNNGTPDATLNAFIDQLEGFLGTTRTEINVTDLFLHTRPENASAPTLREMLNITYPALISLDQVALVADPFIAAYQATHSGRMPFINPAPLVRWDFGRALPPGQKDKELANKATFMQWFAENVIKNGDPETCSDSIFLYPQSTGEPVPRNQYIGPPGVPSGFSAGRIASFAEVPDMVVPIGEAPFNSTITGETEFLPVTMSFLAAKNCDLMLFNLFASLEDAGILKPVVTGTRLFS